MERGQDDGGLVNQGVILKMARARQRDGELAHNPPWARREEQDAVAQRDSLADIVSDEENRLAGRRPNRLKLKLKAVAGQGIECAEGFVHQQHRRVKGERTGEGGALAHAARELVDETVLEAGQVYEINEVAGGTGTGSGGESGLPQAKLDITLDIEPREERGLLKKQHPVGAGATNGARISENGPGARGFEASDEAEQRRLAATAGAKQTDKLTGAHLKGERGERLDASPTGHKVLRDPSKAQGNAARLHKNLVRKPAPLGRKRRSPFFWLMPRF